MNFNFSFFKKRNLEEPTSGNQPDSEVRFNSMSPLNSAFRYVHPETAMKFTAVYAAMRLRAESIASLPKMVTEKTINGKVDAKNHSTYKLLKYRPNGWMNVFTFWEYLNACLDGWGNAYAIILRSNNGTPYELIPIHSSLVHPTFRNRRKWFRVTGSKGFDGIYENEDMLHFFSLSLDGISGVNPIIYNAASIQSGISATKFGNEFFEKGGNLKGVYEVDKMIDTKDYQKIQEHLSKYSDHDTPILEGGLKYRTIGIEPQAAQMLETRTFAIQDIARIFNVPPHFLADLSRSTFSNIEHQDIQYVKYSLRSTVKRYETELDLKLMFDDEMGIVQTKFNLDGMLRGDMKTRAEYYSKAVQNGWLSRNEIREMENLNSADSLGEFLYPQNLAVSGKKVESKKDNKNDKN